MKRNAMIRIIIWSICLVLLSSMLFTVLAVRSARIHRKVETVPIEKTATIEDATNPQEAAIDGSQSVDFNASFNFDPNRIHSLEIEWVAGHIRIQPMETDEILISESPVSGKKDSMVWNLEDGQLSIEFCEDDDRFFGFDFGDHTIPKKDLTIYVPMNWECRSLEIDAASATVEVEELTIREVEFDGASGTCEFRSCHVERMDIDTASGDIRFSGQLGTLDCDAASADILAVLENVPTRIDVDTMSGDLDITLPQDAGFALKLDSLNDTFSSEFKDVTVQNGEYIRGNKACRITVNAMSGNVMIRNGQ